jgi:hypothetical protein
MQNGGMPAFGILYTKSVSKHIFVGCRVFNWICYVESNGRMTINAKFEMKRKPRGLLKVLRPNLPGRDE